MKLPPYPRYKPSSVDWLGELPVHWEVKRGRFCTAVNPPSTRLRRIAESDPDADVSFVPMSRVGEYGDLRLDQTRNVSDLDLGHSVFEDGDVIVAKITPCFENGKGALAAGLLNGVAIGTTELHVLRALPNLAARFLFYFTMSHAFRSAGEGAMYGAAGQKRVPSAFCKNAHIPLPPDEEQLAIADYLDGATAKIDTLVVRQRELIKRLREKSTSLILRSVTRGLPAGAAVKVGLDPQAKLKDTGVDWLGDVPEHWMVERLKWTVARIVAGVWGREANGSDDVVCVRVADFDRDRFCVVDEPPTLRAVDEAERIGRLLRKGDLLIEKSGGGDKQLVGCVVLFDHDFPAVCSNFVARMQVRSQHVPRFWCYVHAALYIGRLNYPAIKQTTGIQNLDTAGYLDTLVGIPPSEEQHAIAAFLDRETTEIDALITRIEIAIKRLQEYRTALITAAVTGRFDVREATG